MDANQIGAFWSKVDVKDSKFECWPWIGAKKPKGYGNLRVNKAYMLAHRVAFSLSSGVDVPSNMNVCHLCDNPSCCNPSHLVMGADAANFCDMLIKGRQQFRKNKAIGARNCNAKLTDEKVREIRRMYCAGETNQYELAVMFGVSQPCIGSITRGKTWRHVE